MYINTLRKTAILVKLGHLVMEKMSPGFPSYVLRLLCLSAVLFSEAVTNNNPLLQLQLRSAGSLHVAFRNLRESQSPG